MKEFAPIALFVYNRLDCTQVTIEHLKQNSLATQTIIYIFSDGGKDEASWKKVQEVRNYLHTITGFKKVHIIERPENYYLERNVIEGIAYVLERHDTIIVMEDDICSSPILVEYFNNALQKYENISQVMHIASFTNLDIPEMGDTYFTPHMSGCGCWATWKNKWTNFKHYASKEEALSDLTPEMIQKIEYGGNFPCLKSLNKNPIPWDICWEITIHKMKGLCLHPSHTLIRNIGLSSGTHFNAFNRIFGWYEYDRPYRTHSIILKDIPIKENPIIENMYAQALKDHGMRYNWFGKIARYFYKKFFKKTVAN